MIDEMFPIMQVREYCTKHNIHEVCLYCNKACKTQYFYWSGQMSPNTYCDQYEGSKLAELFTQIITKIIEDNKK